MLDDLLVLGVRATFLDSVVALTGFTLDDLAAARTAPVAIRNLRGAAFPEFRVTSKALVGFGTALTEVRLVSAGERSSWSCKELLQGNKE